MTIIESLRDRRMLGALEKFQDLSTWHAWLVFLCAVYGLALSALRSVGLSEDQALQIFCECTGRTAYNPPQGGYQDCVAITGRQAAKTTIATTIVAFEAVTAQPQPDGTETYGLLIGQDHRAALRTLFSYAVAPFDTVPAFARMVPSGWRSMWQRARRADSLTLSNGFRIAAYPCRPASVRGVRAKIAVLDEFAHYRNSEGAPVDAEMLAAVRPALAMTGGRLVILSSPYGQSGALHDLHARYFGRGDAGVLVWRAPAPTMNPLLPADYLARMERDDPAAFRSEVLGEFRDGVATFLDPAALDACVDRGVRERPFVRGVRYVACFDPSGGRSDAAALSIAHAARGVAIEDVSRAWPAPHNPAGVIAEVCDVLRAYGIAEIRTDRYAGEFVAEQFRAHGIRHRTLDQDRSGLYLGVLPLVNAGQTRLLDNSDTLRQMGGLERRRGPSGRDRVDHRPGAHDDRANALAAALVSVGPGRRCVSPLCDDETCTGRAPLLMFSDESTEWWRKHPTPETLAAQQEIERAVDATLAKEEADDRADAESPIAQVTAAVAAGFSTVVGWAHWRRKARASVPRKTREELLSDARVERDRAARLAEEAAAAQRDRADLAERVRANGGSFFPHADVW